jgi:hypothetical protein
MTLASVVGKGKEKGTLRRTSVVVTAAAVGLSCGGGPTHPSAREGVQASPFQLEWGHPPAGFLDQTSLVLLPESMPADGSSLEVPPKALEPFSTRAPGIALRYGVRTPLLSAVSVMLFTAFVNERGEDCGHAPNAFTVVRAGEPTVLTSEGEGRFFGNACGFPASRRSLTTTALRITARISSLDSSWEVAAVTTVPWRVTFVAPPLAQQESAPSIVTFDAFVEHEYNGPGAPYTDEIRAGCVVRDPDGDRLTVSIQFTSDGGCPTAQHCWAETTTFSRRATDQPVSAEAGYHLAPEPPARGTATCDVVDERGAHARRSVCVTRPGAPACD